MLFLTNEDELKLFNNKILYFYNSCMFQYHLDKNITIISDIEKKYGIPSIAIDVDFFEKICKRFKIESVPIFIIMNNDGEIKRFNDQTSIASFKDIFSEIYNNGKLT